MAKKLKLLAARNNGIGAREKRALRLDAAYAPCQGSFKKSRSITPKSSVKSDSA